MLEDGVIQRQLARRGTGSAGPRSAGSASAFGGMRRNTGQRDDYDYYGIGGRRNTSFRSRNCGYTQQACGRAGSAGLQLQYKPTSAAASPTHYRRSSSRNQNHQQSPPRHRAVDRESGEIFYAQDNRITLYARAHRQTGRPAGAMLATSNLGWWRSRREQSGRCRRTAGMSRGGGGGGGRRPSGCKAPRSPLPSTPRTTPPAIMNTWPLLPTCARRRRTAIR